MYKLQSFSFKCINWNCLQKICITFSVYYNVHCTCIMYMHVCMYVCMYMYSVYIVHTGNTVMLYMSVCVCVCVCVCVRVSAK